MLVLERNALVDNPSGFASMMRQVGLAAAVLTLLFLVEVLAVGGRQSPPAQVNRWLGRPQDRAEQLVWGMDGKASFQIGVDPTFRHSVEAYGGDKDHAAYRASRPLLGWLAWSLSGSGWRPALGWVLIALDIVALTALVWATGLLGIALERPAAHLILVLAAPETIAALAYPGITEPLGFAFALGGAARWIRGDRWSAVILFALGVFTRETTLLIPLSLGMAHLWRFRRLRGAWPLLVAPVIYGAWLLAIGKMFGGLPRSGGEQLGIPFEGLIAGIGSWGPMEWFSFSAAVGGTWAGWRWGGGVGRWFVGVHIAFVVCMSEGVWETWRGFGRITFPLVLLGIAVAPVLIGEKSLEPSFEPASPL